MCPCLFLRACFVWLLARGAWEAGFKEGQEQTGLSCGWEGELERKRGDSAGCRAEAHLGVVDVQQQRWGLCVCHQVSCVRVKVSVFVRRQSILAGLFLQFFFAQTYFRQINCAGSCRFFCSLVCSHSSQRLAAHWSCFLFCKLWDQLCCGQHRWLHIFPSEHAKSTSD